MLWSGPSSRERIGPRRAPLPSWVHRAIVTSSGFDSVPSPAIRYTLPAPFQISIQEETCPTASTGVIGSQEQLCSASARGRRYGPFTPGTYRCRPTGIALPS
jgi:hypothetical protein